ncbi:hypothetical protein PIB30_022006 [Stylosanthes scabra]|uniref:Uncharacterized protein n=1 Tax=Stylosanthes scabra TaxID=79078 RepID=A0ABU6X6G7_9FABA|nr:hypothetical protein [Stylosanthes scabra]
MESMRRRSRRGYHRLNGSNWWQRRHKKEEVEQLGTTHTTSSSRKRKTWRMKVSRKIRISRIIRSPKKLLLWLRDSYVRMMLGVANSKVMSMSASATGYGGKSGTMSMAVGGVNTKAMKEYDEKMIVHIYKSLLMEQNKGHAPPPPHNKFPSQITCP